MQPTFIPPLLPSKVAGSSRISTIGAAKIQSPLSTPAASVFSNNEFCDPLPHRSKTFFGNAGIIFARRRKVAMLPAPSVNLPQQPATECTIQAPTEKLETLSVDLAERSYPIYIGKGILSNCEEASTILRKHIKGKSCMVVTNTTVGPLYLQQVVDALSLDGTLRVETVVLPDGEQYKTLETMNLIFDALLEAKLDRKTTLIALGGGVIGDITGYAAASYMRGVNFVQIPTTLLAMVDSSVGGKTGVNHRLGKNMIGAFYQPQCVLADVATLDTLPDRELKAGIAEVIKYGLINDLPFFEWLEQNIEKLLRKEAEPMMLAIKRSCERKADIVKQDERESTGMRALLNLGHTFGHAVENNLGYGEWLHGEAVAAGICMAAALSRDLAWISDSELERVVSLTARAGLPTEPPKKLPVSTFLKTMAVDKKVADGQLRLVLMKNLGTSIMTADFTRDSLVAVVERYLPTQ